MKERVLQFKRHRLMRSADALVRAVDDGWLTREEVEPVLRRIREAVLDWLPAGARQAPGPVVGG